MNNIRHMPCQTLSDLNSLDKSEMTIGYLDGFYNRPNLNKNRSYSHGYTTGTSDRTGKVNKWQRRLAKEITDNQTYWLDAIARTTEGGLK